ncbi:hypothetical protein CSPX01_07494 [Colletotrichum filicis]|nr:hypothetical protein CSPX01_07494 [Colletotrichum filicis]
MDGKSLVPSGHLRTRMRCPCHAYLFLSPCHAPIQSTLRSRIAHLQDSIPSHPILSTHHVPSHPITHRPSPIPYPDCPASWSTVHSPQSTTLGRHRRRKRRRGVTRKRAKTLQDISRKSPCALPVAFSPLKSSVQPLLWYCYCIRALCPHFGWRLMKFRV